MTTENISFDAMIFAKEVHKNQRRKYTDTPYFEHLAEVVAISSSVLPSFDDNFQNYLSIAWLHDCIEDCNITRDILKVKFNDFIADGVLMLSDLEKGNRKKRKELSRERFAKCRDEGVHTIKVADLISNTSSICERDPDFAVLYMEEKRLLLDVLHSANKSLLKIAKNIVHNFFWNSIALFLAIPNLKHFFCRPADKVKAHDGFSPLGKQFNIRLINVYFEGG